MITSTWWRRSATTVAVLALALVPAAAPAAAAAPTTALPAAAAPSHRALPEPPPVYTARDELADLPVSEPHSMDGYSRARFPHWALQYGTCDTREVVLERDGQDVVQDDQCRAVAGTWASPYDGKIFTNSKDLDVDHLVPLANAWRSGADLWDTKTRKAFANDLLDPQLVAVSAASNRAKADKGPEAWRPPLRSYWCTYSRAWVHVKSLYHLNVTAAEQQALSDMLDTCV
ncbi:HNH endonuclease family protein [Kitasatospora sp. NPDC057936]|uniref:HNH endonuclease family protein n=1 Tax=Kitasatospora sp. NPDC057936 TaxID=3346283 RepID=UPI0036DE552E